METKNESESKTKKGKLLITVSLFLNLVLFFSFITIRHYPSILIFFHIASIFILWGFLFMKLNFINAIKNRWKELVLILLLTLVAFFVRIYQIEEISPGMYGDEIAVAQWGLRLIQKPDIPPFISEGYYHPTPLLYLTAYSVQTLGHSMTAIRMPNVIIGAASVGAFYILLRIFFPISISLFGAILLIFQYTHIVISRLSYEPTPSLFCQILTLIFLALYWKKKNAIYLIGIGLSLGAGMYTYLNFRPFALLIFLVTIVLLLKHNWKQSLKKVLLFIVIFFIAAMPLFSYVLIDPQGFSGRISELSIFSHNYSPSELTKELEGSILRTTIMPFFPIPITLTNGPQTNGDPNPRNNPATSPMFDTLTVLMSILGTIYLFFKKRNLFWLVILLIIPPILSDVFANENVPEFHYYGIGHPQAMHVSGFILTTLFTATAGLYWIYLRWSKKKAAEVVTLIGIFVIIVSCWNWLLYFNQMQISPGAYLYNYTVNHAQASNTANYLNKIPGEKISITKDIGNTLNFQFFIDSKRKLNIFEPINTENTLKTIQASDVTAIGVTVKTVPILNASSINDLASKGYVIDALNNQFGQPDVIIIRKDLFNLQLQ